MGQRWKSKNTCPLCIQLTRRGGLHCTCSIQEGLRQAKKAGDDKKLGMVASRK